ncbi:hypothetical protein P154DRAFT_240031 [Amniculicola lignicola CBS 123094]|uniref:F-box domain-containing protein n=1 Tax=Amniculicola lignicola CBS 123094 TaxID=1392246 RepID=A0A6A5WAB8_9PLEO|nr:hypothetical protein P154DRAFT_240031 [Amniculicola lignicola CBS 123094]
MTTQHSSHLSLSTLPIELLLRIYEVLPSFNEVLGLKATCRVLCRVWIQYRKAIIKVIAIKHFECYDYAREVLALKRHGSVPVDQEDLSDRDLMYLSRNASRVKKFIREIEQRLIPELKISGLPPGKRITIYGGSDTHPPTLTDTERTRVIRGCYQIWSLAHGRDNEGIVRAKVASIRPRQLFYFAELTEWARVIDFPEDRWDTFIIFKAKNVALKALYRNMYGSLPPKFQEINGYEDPVRLFMIWDHSQHHLRNIVCRRPLSNLCWDTRGELHDHLWDYELGDENFLAKDWTESAI